MKSNVNGMARAALRIGVLAAAALLAGCGGGSQSETFTANRVIALGDEFSVINSDGSKYSVNAVVSGTTTLDCASNPIWIQALAGIYGLVFPQCPGSAVDPHSRIWAANGARVEDLSTQIDTQVLDSGLGAGDLVTVLVGANDVMAQFAQYPGIGEDQLLANLDTAGTLLATQVNRLAALGAKVIVSTIPDMGLTPYARANSTDIQALLTRLSARFNDAMLASLLNDGHKIGLVQLDEFLQATDRAVSLGVSTTYSNATQAACSVALPACTTDTMVSGASSSWLWADDLHFGVAAQGSLASLAITRAQNNPF